MEIRTAKKLSCLALGILAPLLLGITETYAQVAGPRAMGKIAFTSERDGNSEIYVMNADGSEQTRLTYNFYLDDHAMWSPNGKKLAFVSRTQPGPYGIHVMDRDGTNRTWVTELTNFQSHAPTGGLGFSMSWSPDSRKIAFQDPWFDDIWVVDVETRARVNITNDGGGIGFHDFQPSWSPDGSTILYVYSHNGMCPALWTMKPDGTDRRQIVHCQAWSPSWSPDGSKVVFGVLVEDFGSELFTANSDGTKIQTFDGGYPDQRYRDYPRWSPDGSKIAFSMTWPPDLQIYVKNIGGSRSVQLTNKGRNYRPSWEPTASAP